MTIKRIAARIALVVPLIASQVAAQTVPLAQCGPRDAMSAMLAERYGEAMIFEGLERRGSILTLWVNRDTGSWTMIATGPDRQSCMLANGSAGSVIPLTAVGDPA
jgi:hypothetical protein